MAERVSESIFSIFGWSKHPLHNKNWKCAQTDVHRTQPGTHPSDVVFSYDDPYDLGPVYVTTDLKSYAKGTITKPKVAGAVRSLAMTTDCANQSEDFQKLFVADDGRPSTIVGLLFIYNHDGEYSADFDALLADIDERNFELAPRRRTYIVGPHRIAYLYNVARDITHLRGTKQIPFGEECHFYYPDMVRTTARTGKDASAASLEWLLGPWQILRFARQTPESGVRMESYVYYRDPGASTDEFKYLFDYLFRYQLVDPGNAIHVRFVPTAASDPNAAARFTNAKTEYVSQTHPSARDDLALRLADVKFSMVETTYLQFSDTVLGMRDE